MNTNKGVTPKFRVIKVGTTLKGRVTLIYDGILAIVSLDNLPVKSSSNLTEMMGFFDGMTFLINYV